jgi:hypothetical protein
MTQCIFDSSTATVLDSTGWWEHVLDYKYRGRLRSRDCADYWVRKIAQAKNPEHQPRFVVGTEQDNLLDEFPGIQFLVLPRMAIRVLLSHFEPTRQPGALALMALACQLSMQPRADARPFKKAIRYYPRSEDPIWPALGRHISRRSTARDRKLLVALAQNPEKRQGHLSWGLKYIVRGDIRLDDQSVITLDDLAQELRLPTLPYLDELPPHLED